MDKQRVIFSDLGKMPYKAAWEFQELLLQQNVAIKATERMVKSNDDRPVSATTHHFLLCEHPPVYTLGKSGSMDHVLLSDAEMQQRGIEFFRTNRGGDITFHGPDQVVGYPILDLEKFGTDIGKYLRNLEEVVIRTLKYFNITGTRSQGETGVWIEPGIAGRERKICAIGVRCSRWITMHGFALNVNTDLDYFENIIPCGIHNKMVTSVKNETGTFTDTSLVKKLIKENFEEVFNVILQEDSVKMVN